MKKAIVLFLLQLATCIVAYAQLTIPRDMPKDMYPGGAGKAGKESLLMIPKADNSIPSEYKNYSDDNLEEFDRKMKERAWERDDTAWERACAMNTVLAYERYSAMYPNGAHIAEAKCRLVDANITEMLNNAHTELPDIECIETDEESETSTLLIENHTGLPLTIYYSGFEDKSRVVIPENGSTTLVLENGEYKLAASVPPKHIRPYAGKTTLYGGKYKVGFWIVYR